MSIETDKSGLKRVEEYFVAQPYPYGEDSGFWRQRTDSGPGNELFTYGQALELTKDIENINKMLEEIDFSDL